MKSPTPLLLLLLVYLCLISCPKSLADGDHFDQDLLQVTKSILNEVRVMTSKLDTIAHHLQAGASAFITEETYLQKTLQSHLLQARHMLLCAINKDSCGDLAPPETTPITTKVTSPLPEVSTKKFNCSEMFGRYVGSQCLNFHEERRSHTEAEKVCQKEGGTLFFPALNDEDVGGEVLRVFPEAKMSGYISNVVWIAGNFNPGEGHVSPTGEVIPIGHQRWWKEAGEPQTKHRVSIGEDCLVMKIFRDDPYRIGDWRCGAKNDFFCLLQ